MGCLCSAKQEVPEEDIEEPVIEQVRLSTNEGFDDSMIDLKISGTEYDFTLFNSLTLRSNWTSGLVAPHDNQKLLINDMMREETFRSSGSQRKPTLSFACSLAQTVQFQIGNELLCMTWNIHNDIDATPFEFYCDFRTLGLKERDSVSIEILWDVARVFLFIANPTELCLKTALKSVLPVFLINACGDFCEAVELQEDEKKQVMNLPNTSLHDFVNAFSYNEDSNKLFHKKFSFLQLHQGHHDRKSSPLRPGYDPAAFKWLLERDPKLLPLLILDFLHVLVIRFSGFLIQNKLRKAFSEFTPEDQIQRLVEYSEQQGDSIQLTLPKQFLNSRHRLYAKWNKIFRDSNKIQQVWKKASLVQADIIMLQQVTPGSYRELENIASEEFNVLPEKFPEKEDEATVLCIRRSTVNLEKDSKIKYLNQQNFAVLCRSSDILYYVCVVNLTPGETCGDLRKKEAIKLMRSLGRNTPTIVGGNFNEDLTAVDNPVAKIMLKQYNGIDHTQDEPLVFSVNRTRTNLQFQVAKSDQQDKEVDDGIFSSFPLVGEAFTDFVQTGAENPSDHGPVFQRIMLGIF